MGQLELNLYPRGCLREATTAYLHERAEYVAEATMTDYWERSRWLFQVFGETVPLEKITYDKLREVERKWGPKGKGMMYGTIKKRFAFLLSIMKLAVARGIIKAEQIPIMPKIADDGRRRNRFLTITEYQHLRLALGGDRMRTLVDLGFWTGMHRYDLWEMKRWMLEPDYEWKDDEGKTIWRGRWWRTNHKNRRCTSCWMPMEPEFVEASKAILAQPGSPDGLIVGRVFSYAKALHAACDRIEIPLVCLIDLRHSLATLLLERTSDYEYVRLTLGHEGQVLAGSGNRYQGSGSPSILTRHYLHASPSSLMASVAKRMPAKG